jgi:hypothetical protein
VVVNDELIGAARALFGDESTGYDDALQRYYRDGPSPGWEARYISSYASAHPAEDWAECWAHYLHICAVLEVAEATGLRTGLQVGSWQTEFIDLAVAINEVLRSMGLADAYPFVITGEIGEKIDFVHRSVMRFIGRPGELGSAAG